MRANKTQGVVILSTSLQIGDGDGDLVGQFAKLPKRGQLTVTKNCKKREGNNDSDITISCKKGKKNGELYQQFA